MLAFSLAVLVTLMGGIDQSALSALKLDLMNCGCVLMPFGGSQMNSGMIVMRNFRLF